MKYALLGLLALVTSCVSPVYAQQCVSRDAQTIVLLSHPRYASHQMLTAGETAKALAAIGTGSPNVIENGLWVVRDDASSVIFAWHTDGTCGFAVAPPEAGPIILKAVRGVGA